MMLAAVLAVIGGALAQTTTTATTPTAVATSVASPTVPLSATLPSQVALPPKQAWCPSDIFCAGALLQTVNIASVYTDPKTFVDKPTNTTPQAVLDAFAKIPSNGTEQDIVTFVDNFFRGEGLELEGQALQNFSTSPAFLNNVTDPLVKAFAQTVHEFWPQLVRATNQSTLCDGVSCQSTLIPLNHTFVIPGGRFREQYYWDSFWIVEGLLESQLFDIANATLQNFMDEVARFGFIPNGGRIYYLDRSQPPLFIQMLSRYVQATNDTTILSRGLPIAEKELQWWQNNRMVNVSSPFTKTTHRVAHYAVNNTAPRPESYLTDYNTANGPNITLNASQRAALYAELASGAETGWDYTTRWISTPNGTTPSSDLTKLNVRNTIPVCLNSILYKDHLLLADLYQGLGNTSAASKHRTLAAPFKAAILDLFWDSSKLAFYDFNLATNTRNTIFSAATFYPYWSGIIPTEVLTNSTAAFSAFSSVNLVLNRYNGTFPSTFIETGLQWDAPNAWPPHQYVILNALKALPANVTSGSIANVTATSQDAFGLVPNGQLGITEGQLPGQPVAPGQNSSSSSLNVVNGTVVNGGNATSNEGWAEALQRQLANRYVASALCSWHATGGSIPNILPRLSDQELNVTLSTNNTGNMFEKFSNLDIDSSGSGGEYTVQAGFGWTNGVLLWVASTYGDVLVAPQCPDLLASAAAYSGTGGGSGSNSTTSGGGSGNGNGGSGTNTTSSGSGGSGSGAATSLVATGGTTLLLPLFLTVLLMYYGL